jgi:hypothetical protein
MADRFNIEILEDGSYKITTDGVSMANHVSAEAFIRLANIIMGGESKRTRRIDVGASSHLQDALHSHAEDGHTHSHS